MNLADVFTVVFITLGFLIVFVGYWLLAAGLFPRFVERNADQLGEAPVKTTIVGAATLAPLVIIGLVISNKAPNGGGKLLGLGIALIALLLALLGSAGLALRIGCGLAAARDAQEPWRRVLRGGIVLAITFMLPFIGWFVMLPLTLASGFGALVIGAFKRRPVAVPLPAAASVPPPVPTLP